VYSVQRLESDGRDAVNAAISIKNVGDNTRTVIVTIAWMGPQSQPSEAAEGTTETVTLRPQESRDLMFTGAPGARDFKVNLTYPGS
jgi:hypothetical protein